MEVYVSQIRSPLQAFLKTPGDQNLLTLLHKQLFTLENSQLNAFQHYILVPLISTVAKLSNPQDNAVQIQLINTMKEFIHRIHIKNVNELKTIIIILLNEIRNFKKTSFKENASEELKLAVIECINETLCRATYNALEQFYVEENCGTLAQTAINCVDLIELEKYRHLRIAAVMCLEGLFYVHDAADKDDIVLRNQVADVTFLFLPKIVTVLCKILLGDELCGQKLLMISTRALANILCIIYEDSKICEVKLNYETQDFMDLMKSNYLNPKNNITDNEILGESIKKKDYEENFKKMQKKGRDLAWFGASSRKIKQVIQKMVVLRSNNSIKVRLEYAKMSCLLALKCPRNLKENLSIFLETIIAFSQDDDTQIQCLCKNVISDLHSYSYKCDSEFNLNAELEMLFDVHLTRLPSIINRCNELEQYAEFLFVKGFFNNLPYSNLQMILSVPGNLEKLTKCLISAYELELTNELLQNEYALRLIDEDQNDIDINQFSWKKFKHISSKRIESILNDICIIIGKSSIVNLFFDQLFVTMSKNRQVYNECALILMIMLTGNNEDKNNSKMYRLHNYLDELLEQHHWHLALEADDIQSMKVAKKSDWFSDSTPGLYESAIEIRISDINYPTEIDEEDSCKDGQIKIWDAQFNVLHTCLILEAFGNVALSLGNDLKPYVFTSLHRVLLKTGSSNYLVHKSGSLALHCIRKALGFHKISELIQHYSDYISYHINISLRKTSLDSSKSAVDILTVVLRYSSLNSLSHLENILLTILNELTNIAQISNVTSYLKVFDIFLQSVEKWRQARQHEIIIENPHIENEQIETCLYDRCIEILQTPLKGLDMPDLNMNETPNEMEDDKLDNYEPEKTESELPKHVSLVLNILTEVLKFIASKNQLQQVMALECVINGLPLLSEYEKEFLPLVHLIWYSFAERFKINDPIVLHRCFILLEILAQYAKDFLMQRTLTDIFPFFNDFLMKSLPNSFRDANLTPSQELKLQIKLLQNFANIIINMEIKQKPLDDISNVIVFYLNKKQPKILQESAIGYFTVISNYDRPAMYIKLLYYIDILDYKENVSLIFENLGLEMN